MAGQRGYDVRIRFYEEALTIKEKRGGEIVKDAAEAAVDAGGSFLVPQLVRRTPSGATGFLRQGVTYERKFAGSEGASGRVGFTGPGSAYAEAVEFGARPHWPPIAPIRHWAQRVLGDASAAYPIAAAIAKRGTPAQKMVERTGTEAGPQAEQVMIRAVDEVMRRRF